MFVINNFDNTQLLSEIMIGAIAEAMLHGVSLKLGYCTIYTVNNEEIAPHY